MCAFMSNNIEQNGRQLTASDQGQAAPPTDPRTRNIPQTTPDSVRICRDFVWGICLMNEHCKYRHELEFESMRSILKFCHDYQNRTGCARQDCTYLHTSREEENLFLTTGQIPRVLAERYASMSVPLEPTPEPVPQMMYINEYITQPPPPPPPLSSGGAPPAPPQPVPAPPVAAVQSSVPGQIPGSNMSGSLTPTLSGAMSGSMPGLMPSSMNNLPITSMAGVMPGSLTPSVSGPIAPSMSAQVAPSLSGPMHPSVSVMPVSSMMPVPRPMEQASTPSQIQMSMPHGMQSSMTSPVPTVMPTILAPPPPPPPTVTTASSRMTAPVYTVPPPVQQTMTAMYPMAPCPQMPQQSQQPAHPLSLPVMFDPSRPPPPLPVVAQSRAQKRPSTGEPEAGPSKARKTDGSHDSLCENCVQREIRNELYRQEIENLQREEEYKRLLYEKKTEEYENGRVLLRSLLSPEIFRVMDEHIDSNNPVPSTSSDLFASTSSPPYSSGHSTVPKQFLLQLMEYVLNTSKPTVEHTPSLETITRRASPQADVLSSILDLIRNSGVSESRASAIDALSSNRLARLSNGPMDLSAVTAGPSSSRYPALGSMPAAAVGPAGPARYPAPPQPPRSFPPTIEPPQPPPACLPPAPPAYMPYPPPSRPFYQPYQATNNNVAYSPVATLTPRPSTSTAPAATVNGQNYAQYLPRLPHQYYPPFQ